MHKIKINNITVDIVRKDIKNIHLAVYPPTGRVRLAAPMKVNDEAIRLFTISKIGWIKRQQRKFASQDRLTQREFLERESHYFLGRRYLLRIKDFEGAGRIELSSKTYLDMYVRKDSQIDYKKRLLNMWYRTELKNLLLNLIEYWEQRIGVRITFCGIKLMKTKWGSCNIEKKRIWINLELAKKPVHCIEYILVHEMIHILERLHTDRFKELMNKYLPNWKKLKEELNSLPVSHADWNY